MEITENKKKYWNLRANAQDAQDVADYEQMYYCRAQIKKLRAEDPVLAAEIDAANAERQKQRDVNIKNGLIAKNLD